MSLTQWRKISRNEEHRRFGQDGFEMMVDRIAQLEKAIGIHDLTRFTPT